MNLENKSEYSMFIEHYKFAINRRKQQIDNIWETVKFSTSIIIAIITATIALWKYVNIPQVAFMPIFSLTISIWAFLNISRQYRRFIEVTSWINKLERYAGLHFTIEDVNKRFFSEDTHVIPERWYKESKYKSDEKFINKASSFWRHSAYSYLGTLFLVLTLFSGILAYLIWTTPISAQ